MTDEKDALQSAAQKHLQEEFIGLGHGGVHSVNVYNAYFAGWKGYRDWLNSLDEKPIVKQEPLYITERQVVEALMSASGNTDPIYVAQKMSGAKSMTRKILEWASVNLRSSK
jgi:hypothetical protein